MSWLGPPASVWLGCVGEGSGEEAVGPVFGVAACVGEDDRDAEVADLESGELVCEPVAVDVLELEQGAVAGLDDDRGEREFSEPLELEGEGAVGERRGEVVEALALDGGEQRRVCAGPSLQPRSVQAGGSQSEQAADYVGAAAQVREADFPENRRGRHAQMGLNDNTAGWIATTVTYTLGGRMEKGRGTSATATLKARNLLMGLGTNASDRGFSFVTATASSHASSTRSSAPKESVSSRRRCGRRRLERTLNGGSEAFAASASTDC